MSFGEHLLILTSLIIIMSSIMKYRILRVTLSFLLSTILLNQAFAANESLRTTLENAYKAYLQASQSGKESEIEKTVSTYSLTEVRNDLANRGKSIQAEDIQHMAKFSPDLSQSKFIKVIEKGPTAGLLYVKDSPEKDANGKPRVDFLFIKFVKEAPGWKVDGMTFIGAPKLQADGKETEFNLTELPPEFQITGEIPEPPKLLRVAEAAGELYVKSFGWKTYVTINDVEQRLTENESQSCMVEGGLRKGTNTVVILIQQTDMPRKHEPKIKINRVLTNRTHEECFSFEPTNNIAGKHSLTFTLKD